MSYSALFYATYHLIVIFFFVSHFTYFYSCDQQLTLIGKVSIFFPKCCQFWQAMFELIWGKDGPLKYINIMPFFPFFSQNRLFLSGVLQPLKLWHIYTYASTSRRSWPATGTKRKAGMFNCFSLTCPNNISKSCRWGFLTSAMNK